MNPENRIEKEHHDCRRAAELARSTNTRGLIEFRQSCGHTWRRSCEHPRHRAFPVRRRLLNQSRAQERPFQQLLRYFAAAPTLNS